MPKSSASVAYFKALLLSIFLYSAYMLFNSTAPAEEFRGTVLLSHVSRLQPLIIVVVILVALIKGGALARARPKQLAAIASAKLNAYRSAPYRIRVKCVEIKLNNPGRLLEALIFTSIAASSFTFQEFPPLSAALLAIGLLGSVNGLNKAFFSPPVTDYLKISEKWYVSFVVNHRHLRHLAFKLEKLLREDVEASACAGSSFSCACQFVSLLVISAAASSLMMLFLALNTKPPHLPTVLMPLSALAVPFSPLLALKVGKSDRRRGVEEELPFLALYASVAQGANISLYEAFKKASESNLLHHVAKEYAVAKRNVEIIGLDPAAAMDNAVRKHPSAKFRDFIYGYTSILKSGGDLQRYLQDRVKLFLSDFKSYWKFYAEQAVNLGEVLTAFFMLFSAVLIVGALLMPVNAAFIIVQYNYFILPTLTAISYAIVSSIQPKAKDRAHAPLLLPSLAFSATVVVSYFLIKDAWIRVLISFLALSTCSSLLFMRLEKEVRQVDSALEDFLRDVTEFRKIGLSISHAISSLASRRSYNRHFDSLLKHMAFSARLSGSIAPAALHAKSWLSKFVIWLLNEMESVGNSRPALLEELVAFIREVNEAKREARRSFMLYDLLVFITPIFLSIIISGSYRMIESYALILSSAGSVISGLPPVTVPPKLIDEIRVSIVLSTFALSILASKTINFTVANMLRVVLALVVALVSIPLADYIIEALNVFAAPSQPIS